MEHTCSITVVDSVCSLRCLASASSAAFAFCSATSILDLELDSCDSARRSFSALSFRWPSWRVLVCWRNFCMSSLTFLDCSSSFLRLWICFWPFFACASSVSALSSCSWSYSKEEASHHAEHRWCYQCIIHNPENTQLPTLWRSVPGAPAAMFHMTWFNRLRQQTVQSDHQRGVTKAGLFTAL